MFKDKINLILIILLIIGVSLLIYPSLADLWNESRSTKIINSYSESLNTITDQEIEAQLQAATRYNQRVLARGYKEKLTRRRKRTTYLSSTLGQPMSWPRWKSHQ